MKFLFAARNPSLCLQYERVVRGLLNDGHEIVFHLDSMKWRNAKMDTDILNSLREEYKGLFDYCQAVRPKGFAAWILRNKREIMNYAAYVREEHPISTSPYMRERQAQALYRPWDIIMRIRLLGRFLLKKDRLQLLSKLEAWFKPDAVITATIKSFQPDLVMATPFIFARSIVEPEYIKAAKSLGIPTVVSIFSWDNLTSKGIFQVIPDSVLMWNHSQMTELQDIHRLPSSLGRCTGAPSLDFWFEQKPRHTKEQFCRLHGLPEDRPYVVYLCSSQTIAPDEHIFVKEMVSFLRERFGENSPSVLIRPHPLNIDIWAEWDLPGTSIVPRENRDIFYSSEARELFYETLQHSSAVMGLNTTAMVETAIVDKPCMTLVVGKYADTQSLSGHFHHLTDAGFMHTTHSLDEMTDELEKLLAGEDPFKLQRADFVKSFVRPHGIDLSSSQVMKITLVGLAEGASLEIAHDKACNSGVNA